MTFASDSGTFTFIPKLNATFPLISKLGTGTVVVVTNPLYLSGTFSLSGGEWNWGNDGLTHVVAALTASAGTMNFGTITVQVTTGDASFAGAAVTAGSGTLHLSGTGTQVLTMTSAADTLPSIVRSNGLLRLSGASLVCNGFSLALASLDFNGFNISTANGGDFVVSGGGTATFTGLDNRTITVTGNATLSGLKDNLLNLKVNSLAKWYAHVHGTLYANHAVVKNCDASGYSQGRGGPGAVDSTGNINWVFGQFAPLWRRTGMGNLRGGAAGQLGVLYVNGSEPYKLYSISTADGRVRWSFSTSP